MRKCVTLLLLLLLLTGCAHNESVSVIYNETTSSYLLSHTGETVSVCGYMSVASPMDGSFIYLMNKPLSGYPMENYSTDALTDTLVAYPADGTAFIFTEKCVRITGTITENEEYTWELSNCSYEVIAPTDDISSFNIVVDDGSLTVLDNWLSEIYSGISSDEPAVVSSTEYETKLLNGSSNATVKQITAALTSLTASYNEYVNSEDKDKSAIESSYMELQGTMQEWLASLEVRGDE